MSKRTRLRAGLVALVLTAAPSCAPRCPQCPPPGAWGAPPPAVPTAAPAQAAAPAAKERKKVAVLPLREDELFRAERAALRADLVTRVRVLLPGYDVVPVSEVDAALVGVSKAGARCASQNVPPLRRVRNKGWLGATLTQVSGYRDKPAELWLELHDQSGVELTFAGEWNRSLDLASRYRAAFASFGPPQNGMGLLGALAASGGAKGEITRGSLSLCEKASFFECSAETSAWTDAAPELSKCFTGSDAARETVLFEGSRCEITNLHDVSGDRGKTESCLCAALRKSKGASARPGRRRIAIGYEAPDIVGKPRPVLRVIEERGLHSDQDWDSERYEVSGKAKYRSWQRLTVDNLDSLKAPLARCAKKSGGMLTAELEMDATGRVSKAQVLSGEKDKAVVACVEKALATGTFACPSSDEGATLRLAIRYPD